MRAEHQQQDQHEQRWVAHPMLGRLLRCVLFAIPLVVSTGAVLAVRPLVPGGMGWAVALGLLAVVVAVVFERALRRFLPLATLLRLTMLFPDQAPSRYKVARTAGNPAQLGRRLAHDPDAVSTAEQVLALITALGEHDRRTRGHSERVRVFCDLLAEQLHLEQGERDRLRWAALLHDVGKLSIAPTILNKPSKLDDRELSLVKGHPARGAALTAPLLPWLGEWGLGIAEHHERFDGAGYPSGLSALDISRAGRIVGIVDAFETMTAARAYKKPMATKTAREELARCAGTQFDPTYVRAFLAISLPRLVWAMGPLSFVLQLPFLSTIAQAGSRGAAVSGQAATAVAGAGAVAGVGMVGALAPPAPAPAPAADRVVVASAADGRDVDAVAAPPSAGDPPPAGEQPVAAPIPPAPTGSTPTFGEAAVPTAWPFTPASSTQVVRQPAPAPAPVPPPAPAPAPVPVRTPPPPPPPPPPVEVAPVVTLTATPSRTVTSASVTVAFGADRTGTTFTCSVDGGAWTACSSPLVLTLADGEHVVAVRGTSPSGLTGAVVTTPRFVVDSPAPSVRLIDPPTGTVTSPQVSVAFESDTFAATFECSVDGGLWAACTSPFSRSYGDGPHTVDVRAVGTLTGTGVAQRASFVVDVPGPETVLTSVPPAAGTGSTVEVAFESPDAAATFECAVDGGAWTACSSPTRLELAAGPHAVAVRAVSATAGAGPTQTATFSIVPPTAVITDAPSGTTTSNDVQVSFTSDDPGATFECSVDDGSWSSCTSPLSLRLANGSHEVTVRATGATTGAGAPASTGTFVIDAPGPEVAFDVDPPRRVDGPVVLEFSSTDPEATFECRVNGQGWLPCTSPAVFDLPEGNHVLMVRAVSPLSGTGSNLTTGSIRVDHSAPRVVIDSAPAGTVAPEQVVLAFSSPDAHDVDHFECAVDSGTWSTCSSPATFALPDGEHVLSVRAVAKRRNTIGTAATTAPFTVDRRDDNEELGGLSATSTEAAAGDTAAAPEAAVAVEPLREPVQEPAPAPVPAPVEQPAAPPVKEPEPPSAPTPPAPTDPVDPAPDVIESSRIEPARLPEGGATSDTSQG